MPETPEIPQVGKQPPSPIATWGSKGIRKPRADPLNAAGPAIPPQESITTQKNHSNAMKEYWAQKKASLDSINGGKEVLHDMNETMQLKTTSKKISMTEAQATKKQVSYFHVPKWAPKPIFRQPRLKTIIEMIMHLLRWKSTKPKKVCIPSWEQTLVSHNSFSYSICSTNFHFSRDPSQPL